MIILAYSSNGEFELCKTLKHNYIYHELENKISKNLRETDT
jgi:hypothetical protein